MWGRGGEDIGGVGEGNGGDLGGDGEVGEEGEKY